MNIWLVNSSSFSPGKLLLCYHLDPHKTLYINFIIFINSIGSMYNHINYVAISIEPDLSLF